VREVLRVSHEEGSAPGVPVRKKVADASVLVGAAGADATPCIDFSHTSEVEPQPEDVPSETALTLMSPRGSDFSAPLEDALIDVIFIPGSFDIMDQGTVELWLSGYPWVPLLTAN
jgi:hypothetical protein